MSDSKLDAVDKELLYGKFQAGEDRRDRLAYRAAHKALDMAYEEDMNINASKTGIGALGIAGIVAAASICPFILGLSMLLKSAPPAAAPVIQEKTVEKVLMRDADIGVGEVIVE